METKNKDLKEIIHNSFKTLEATLLNEKPFLKNQRKEAYSNFEKTGFPTIKNEEWKYTNLSSVLKQDFALNLVSKISKSDIESFLTKDEKANILVFINGYLTHEFSRIISPTTSLEILSLEEISEANLEKYAGRTLSATDGFTYLNTAFTKNGSFIRIPKGKRIEEPTYLYFISDSRGQNVFSQPRNIIVAEENSEIKLVESYHSIGQQSSFSNVVTEIFLKENVNVEYYKVQNDSVNAYHVGTTQVYQDGKSVFNATTVTISGAIIRNNMNLVLNAEYAEASMYGLYFMDENQHVDNHTIADHSKPNCVSNELYKGILKGKSTGVFNGKIFVRKDAQKTNAFQSNKNILMSKDATMNTKPQLEIFADDVKCSHGATIGQLDEEPLFYLRARGIGEEKAKELLVMAFVQDIIDHIKIDSLRDKLIEDLSSKLNN